MAQISTSFDQGTYSQANKPSTATLKTDILAIKTGYNAHDLATTAVHGITGTIVGTSETQTLTNKTLTSPVLNTGVSGTAVLDEDDMATDSNTQVATQQSIKAYVDTVKTKYLIKTPRDMYPSTTSGCAAIAQVETSTNDVNFKTLDFDASSQEYAEFSWITPPDWDAGTVTAQIFWTTTGAQTGGVTWGVQARTYQDDNALDLAFGTAQEVTDTRIASLDMHVTAETSAITVAGAGAGEFASFRVYRDPTDGGDTLNQDAQFLGIKITYTIT